jgi:hypothetical protein
VAVVIDYSDRCLTLSRFTSTASQIYAMVVVIAKYDIAFRCLTNGRTAG